MSSQQTIMVHSFLGIVIVGQVSIVALQSLLSLVALILSLVGLIFKPAALLLSLVGLSLLALLTPGSPWRVRPGGVVIL